MCIKCNELKILNKDNFSWHNSSHTFSHKCKICINETRRERWTETKQKLQNRIKEHPETRVCKKCNLEKNITLFSFQKSVNSYLYTCKYCDNQEKRFNWKNFSKEEKRKVINRKRTKYAVANKLHDYKKNDTRKNLQFDISKEFMQNALDSDCVYCGFKATGLDRKNNNIGHIESNCVPCCGVCNTTKMNNFSFEEMQFIGEMIKEIKLNRPKNLLLNSVKELIAF